MWYKARRGETKGAIHGQNGWIFGFTDPEKPANFGGNHRMMRLNGQFGTEPGQTRQRPPKWGTALLLAAGIFLSASAPLAPACLEPDGSNDADYIAYGSQFQGRLLILKATFPGGEDSESATYIDRWNAVTAAHNITYINSLSQNNPTYTIETGSNYQTNSGTSVPVASVTIYPGYAGEGNYSGPDIAIIHFAQPLPGTPANIAPVPAADATVNSAGFGYTGTPSQAVSSYTRDGNSRAWNAGVTAFVPNNVSSEYYFSTSFWPDSVSMNGKILGGDSGGPTYDSSGNLIGIHITQVGNGSETGDGVDLKLSETNVMNFITQNSFAPQTLQIQAQGTNLVITWNGVGILQSASDLNSAFSDITNAASPYTNFISNAAQGFFRLRPN